MDSRIKAAKNSQVVIARVTDSGTVVYSKADSFEVDPKPVRKKRKTNFILDNAKSNQNGTQIEHGQKSKPTTEVSRAVSQIEVAETPLKGDQLERALLENNIVMVEEDAILQFSYNEIQEAVETVDLAVADQNEMGLYEMRIVVEEPVDANVSDSKEEGEEKVVASVTNQIVNAVVEQTPDCGEFVIFETPQIEATIDNDDPEIIKELPLYQVKSASSFTTRKLRSMFPSPSVARLKKVPPHIAPLRNQSAGFGSFFDTKEWRTLMEIGWFSCLSSYNLQLLRIHRETNDLLPVISLIVESDFTLKLNVLGKEVKTHEQLEIPKKIRDYDALHLFIQNLNRFNVCRGNPESEIVQYLQDHKRGRFNFVTQSQYDDNCISLVTSRRICPVCFKVRNSVYSTVSRRRKMMGKKLKNFTKDELLAKVKELKTIVNFFKRKYQWGKANKKKMAAANPASDQNDDDDDDDDESEIGDGVDKSGEDLAVEVITAQVIA